jgi:hypothetical protein
MLMRHCSFEKLELIQQNHQYMSVADFKLLFNKWDKTVTQLTLGSEKQCNKFYDRSIEFSPVVSIWILFLQAYQWVQHFHKNMVPHRGNLLWTCRCLNILLPTALTPAQVIMNIEEYKLCLMELKKEAPKLRMSI